MTAHFFVCPEATVRILPDSLRDKGIVSACKEGLEPASESIVYECCQGRNRVNILATRTEDGTYFLNVNHPLNPFFWWGNKRLLATIISTLRERGAQWGA